ncbi:putative membrane protein [plant metagenome]|uniref:Putative membrane protein n=1 Tax=plant metagenome TaxID=1297885 RepID=A0A484Q253_9ZZZZ
MNPNHLQLAARVLIAQIFFIAGIRKALTFAGTAAYFTRLGLPAAELVTVLVILIEIGGSIALVLGWRLRDVAIGLGVFTLASAFIGHAFWSVEPAQFAGQLNNFMKNVAMAGGFLLLALQGHKSAQQG